MPADNQNDQEPDPGPRPSIQPIFSSALFTIKPMEQRPKITAMTNSAVLTDMMFFISGFVAGLQMKPTQWPGQPGAKQ